MPNSIGLSSKVFSYPMGEAVCLDNGLVSVVLDSLGTMVPEFGLIRGRSIINAHYIPSFRNHSSIAWDSSEGKEFWKEDLLYHMAGDYLCSPNFGGANTAYGEKFKLHGYLPYEKWKIEKSAVEDNIAFVKFSLNSPNSKLPLTWEKYDYLPANSYAYFSICKVKNNSREPIQINIGRHTTLGAPFLQSGCRIYASADKWESIGIGSGFEISGRLAPSTQFESLKKAPLLSGSTIDISYVPGPNGYTDFVTGAIPQDLHTAFSAVINPELKLIYINFFPSFASVKNSNDIALGFNDLWMQYGGRNYTPWSSHDFGRDRIFCLGTENMIANFGSGLDYSLKNPELLGNPTLVTISPKSEKRLIYASAILEASDKLLKKGISKIEAENNKLILCSKNYSQTFTQIDACFNLANKF